MDKLKGNILVALNDIVNITRAYANAQGSGGVYDGDIEGEIKQVLTEIVSKVKLCDLHLSNQQVIDYCLENTPIAKAIASQYNDKELLDWETKVIQEFAIRFVMSPTEAEKIIRDEMECLYKLGISNISEAVDDLSHLI